jgi:hypothetical protein
VFASVTEFSGLAQLVEQAAVNRRVAGSSPAAGAKKPYAQKPGMGLEPPRARRSMIAIRRLAAHPHRVRFMLVALVLVGCGGDVTKPDAAVPDSGSDAVARPDASPEGDGGVCRPACPTTVPTKATRAAPIRSVSTATRPPPSRMRTRPASVVIGRSSPPRRRTPRAVPATATEARAATSVVDATTRKALACAWRPVTPGSRGHASRSSHRAPGRARALARSARRPISARCCSEETAARPSVSTRVAPTPGVAAARGTSGARPRCRRRADPLCRRPDAYDQHCS